MGVAILHAITPADEVAAGFRGHPRGRGDTGVDDRDGDPLTGSETM